jgi:Ca2+-dependent lipid-binding protein
MTSIQFFMVKAENLKDADGPFNGTDAYVYIEMSGRVALRTGTVQGSEAPEWMETLNWDGVEKPASQVVDITVYDDDVFKDDKIGHCRLDLGTLIQTDEPQEFTMTVDEGFFWDATLTFQITTDGSWGNPPDNVGDLVVRVIKCSGLDDADYHGTTDPYAFLQIEGCESLQTDKAEGTINPEWDQELTFTGIPAPLSKTLKITIYDDDTWSRDDKIGYCEVDLADLVASEEQSFEITVDTMFFGLLNQATLSFTLKAEGWGNLI